MQRTEEFTIVEFEPANLTRDEWTQFHEFRRERHQETRPDDPIDPDDVVETWMKQKDPESANRRFFVRDIDGNLAANFSVSFMLPHAAAYDSNKHLMNAGGSVRAAYRRKGIGTMIARRVAELMDEHERTVLSTGVEQEEGHAFLRYMEAEQRFRAAENRLDFRKIDWPKIESWIADGEKRSPDTKMHLYEHRLPKDVIDEYLPVMSEVLNTMPFEELDHGQIEITPEVMAEWYKQMDEVGESHHTYIAREPDGSISAMTDVFWSPHKPTYVNQAFTGVHPNFRGRGLGRWVKAQMLVFLRDKYGDIDWIVTGNAGSNKWMLAINEEIGFRKYKDFSMYQIGRESLQKRLADI